MAAVVPPAPAVVVAALPPAPPPAPRVLAGWAVLADCVRYAYGAPVHMKRGEFLKAVAYDVPTMQRDIAMLNLPLEPVYD